MHSGSFTTVLIIPLLTFIVLLIQLFNATFLPVD